MSTYEFSRRETARFLVVDCDDEPHTVIEFTTFERRVSVSKSYAAEKSTRVDYELLDGSRLSRNQHGGFDAQNGLRRYFIAHLH